MKQNEANESPLKIMKTASYLTLKVLFFLKVLNFLSWFFGRIQKRQENL